MGRCKLGALTATDSPLHPLDVELLTEWSEAGTDTKGRAVSAVALANALCIEGHAVGPTTCKDHRARRCVCYRKDTKP